jgi:hypothetical protein
MRRLIACLLLASSLPAMAEIFSYTDANGNTVFTNDPPQDSNAQNITLPPVNGMPAPPSSSPNTEPQNTPSQAPSTTPNIQPPRQTIINQNDDDDGDASYDNFNADEPNREILAEPRREDVEAHRR